MVAMKEDLKRLYEAYDTCLSDKEKKVIQYRYGLFGNDEYTQREIAKALGISRSYVSRIEKGALAKMRRYMQ